MRMLTKFLVDLMCTSHQILPGSLQSCSSKLFAVSILCTGLNPQADHMLKSSSDYRKAGKRIWQCAHKVYDMHSSINCWSNVTCCYVHTWACTCAMQGTFETAKAQIIMPALLRHAHKCRCGFG